MVATMNGWTRIDRGPVGLETITAGGLSTTVRAGDVAVVLAEVARRFHAEVEPLVTFHGWRSLAVNTSAGGVSNSNHLSGTAVDLNGGSHPRYKHGTFTADQQAAIRRILADLDHVVRWGGDWNGDGRMTEPDTDEMHFEVVGTATAVKTVADLLRARDATPTPTPPTPTFLEALMDTTPVIFFETGGDMYEADLLHGQYWKVSGEATLADRKVVLDRAGIPWREWRNAAGTPHVENPRAFGRLVG